MIKKLSKKDYYRSRSITNPKQCPKIQTQHDYHTHQMPCEDTLESQLQVFIENNIKLQRQSYDVNYEKTLHIQESMISRLKMEILDREQQISNLRFQSDKGKRHTNELQKEIFSLRNQLQYIQYEYKTRYEYYQNEYANERRQYQEEIVGLKNELEGRRREFEGRVEKQKQSYEARLKSMMSKDKMLAEASEVEFIRLKQDVERYVNENKRLAGLYIECEREVEERTRVLREENSRLREQLQQEQMNITLLRKQLSSEISTKDSLIAELSNKLSEMIRRVEHSEERLHYQKQQMEKMKSESENNFRKKIDGLVSEKFRLESDNRTICEQNRCVKQEMNRMERRVKELQNRYSDSEREKHEIVLKNQENFDEYKSRQKVQYQNQLMNLKKQLNLTIENLMIENGDRLTECNILKQKLSKLYVQNDERKKKLRSQEEQIRLGEIEVLQIKEKNDKLMREIGRLRDEMQGMKINYEEEKRRVLIQFESEKVEKYQFELRNMNNVIRQGQMQNEKLRGEIGKIQMMYKEKEKSLIHEIQMTKRQANNKVNELVSDNGLLKRKVQEMDVVNEQLRVQHKIHTDELYRMIELDKESVRQSQYHYEQMRRQSQELKRICEGKENEIERVRKEMKSIQVQFDQYKLEMIRKFTKTEEQFLDRKCEIENEKNEILKMMKKLENDLELGRSRLQFVSESLANAEKQRQIYIDQNRKLKEMLSNKELVSVNQMELETVLRRQISEKMIQESRENIGRLQMKNDSLLEQFKQEKTKSIQLTGRVNEYEVKIQELIKKMNEKQNEKNGLQQKSHNQSREITELEFKVTELETRNFSLETEKKRLTSQITIMSAKAYKYEQNLEQMRKSCIFESQTIESIRSKNQRLTNQIKHYESQLQSLKEFYQMTKVSVNQKQTEIRRKEEENQDLMSQIKRLKNCERQLNDMLEGQRKENERRVQELNVKVSNLNNQKKKFIEDIEKQKSIHLLRQREREEFLEKEITSLKNEIINFRLLVKQFQGQLSVKDEQIEKKQRKIDEIRSELNQLQRRQTTLMNKLNSLEQNYETTLKNMSEQSQNERKRRLDIESEYQKVENLNRSLQIEKENLVIRLQISVKQKQQSERVLKEQMGRFNFEREEFKSKLIHVIEKSKREFENENSIERRRYERRVEELTVEKSDYEIKIKLLTESFYEQISKYEEVVEKLRVEIRRLTRENSEMENYKHRWLRFTGQFIEMQKEDQKKKKQLEDIQEAKISQIVSNIKPWDKIVQKILASPVKTTQQRKQKIETVQFSKHSTKVISRQHESIKEQKYQQRTGLNEQQDHQNYENYRSAYVSSFNFDSPDQKNEKDSHNKVRFNGRYENIDEKESKNQGIEKMKRMQMERKQEYIQVSESYESSKQSFDGNQMSDSRALQIWEHIGRVRARNEEGLRIIHEQRKLQQKLQKK